MTKNIRISEEAYKCLEQARLPGEDVNDTLLRLIKRYEQQEQIKFIKRQKQTPESEGFTPIDERKE